MKRFKKSIAICAITVLLAMGATVSAYAVNESPYQAYSFNDVNVGVHSWFIAGNNFTGSQPKYGASANRYMKRTYVHLVEGDYNKYNYSAWENEVSKNTELHAKLSKMNNLFKTAYATWAWDYY